MRVELATIQHMGRAIQETFRLYRRTHLAHWNVRGPDFPQLHALFEEQYTELWNALDALAERARSLGTDVEPTWLTGEDGSVETNGQAIVRGLAADHRAITQTFQQLAEASGGAGDVATEDLAVERMRAHDQMAWMLEATSA